MRELAIEHLAIGYLAIEHLAIGYLARAIEDSA